MNKNLYLIIKTDSYTGNFERELMAYVFGYNDQEDEPYAEEDLLLYQEAAIENDIYDDPDESEFTKYIDTMRRGRNYGEYHGYFIHRFIDSIECDSIFIALDDKLPENLYQFMLERLKLFENRYNIKILNIGYFRESYSEV